MLFKSKGYTILVVPEKTKKVIQWKIPDWAVKVGVATLSFIILCTIISITGYFSIKSKLVNYRELERENTVKSEQLKLITAKVDKMEKQVEDVKRLSNQLMIITNIEAPEKSNKPLGIGGPTPTESFKDLSALSGNEERVIRQLHGNMDKLQASMAVEKDSLLDLINFLGEQKSFLASTPSVWPTRGIKTSSFGYRESPFTNGKAFHEGVDIAAREGTPIIAPADGIIETAQSESNYGNLVEINHGYGFETKFGHLSAFLVERGQKIRRGDIIGYVGSTGKSTGPHLHYEVRVNKVPVNPMKYIIN